MAGERRDEWIVVTEDAKTLPVIELLTGRGFITGKSGSGKSNTASVIAEELLSRGYGMLIVDTEGEYFGLKEEFELLHAGGDDRCDVRVGTDDSEEVASVAIEGNMPVVLDVSGYFDTADAEAVIESVVSDLYALEGDARKPFLLMVEELQEYLPQSGGGTDLAKLLERVAKRGRKRGLGICGISQRPSSVDKDFITQCDWMVWHRLTWETDVNVVRNILGSDRAADVQDFNAGEAILMTEWDDTIETVQFKRKRTLDAGATPGLDRYDHTDRSGVSSPLLDEAGEGYSDGPLEEVVAEPAAPPDGPSVDRIDSGMDIGPVEDSSTGLDLSTNDQQRELEDLDDRSREELVEAVTTERQRAEILAAEVKELRSVLQAVDRSEQTRSSSEVRATLPERPHPPRPPVNRTGVAGNLIEFGELITYMVKLSWYRVRLAVYETRSSSST